MATSSREPGTALPLRPHSGLGDEETAHIPAQEHAGLWNVALQRLPDKDRELIDRMNQEQSAQDPHESSPTSSPELDKLIELTRKKQEDCERKAWKVPVSRGHEIILRDIAAKIINWLNTLKEIGDVAVQYDPVTAALPWAAVRFFIQVAVQKKDQMYHLLDVVETVTRITIRCGVYERLYPPTPNPQDYVDSLHKSLVTLYEAVFKVIAHAYSLFCQGTAKRTLQAIIKPHKLREMMQDVAACESVLREAAATCDAVQVSDIKSISNELRFLLKQFENPLFRTDRRVVEHMEQVDKAERLSLLEWISPVLFGSYHVEVRDSRTPGTCEWLLRDARFQSWQEASSSNYLLLYGIRKLAGAGKTFLTSRVIEFVEHGFETNPSDESFAYFYCKRDEKDRSDPLQVLRSLVRQLSTGASQKYSEMVNISVRKLWSKCKERGTGLTLATCQAQLTSLVDLYPQTTIVLDALDECDKSTREVLMNSFDSLMECSSKPVKIFISSRRDVDILDHFEARPAIEISATDNHDDIAKFVTKEIGRHRRWSRMPIGLREKIKLTLLEQSDGMFQWAAVQIKQLLDLRSTAAMEDLLGKLPRSLKESYDVLYRNVEALHPYEKLLADRAFQWVMCASRPLTTAELVKAICVNPEEDRIPQMPEIDETVILELCQNLLVIDSQSGVWRFSHLSVAEYFESNHFTILAAHSNAAGVCLVLLNSMFGDYLAVKKIDRSLDVVKTDLQNWLDGQGQQLSLWSTGCGLKNYAMHYLWFHVLQIEPHSILSGIVDPRITYLLKRFLGGLSCGGRQFEAWANRMVEPTHNSPLSPLSVQFTSRFHDMPEELLAFDIWYKPMKPIFIAGILGLFQLLSDWWADPGLDVNQSMTVITKKGTSDMHWPLISLAALNEDPTLLEYLVMRNGVQVQCLDNHVPPLTAAALGYYSSTSLECLLGAGFNASGTNCDNYEQYEQDWARPLCMATRYGTVDTVRLLLNAGANPEGILHGRRSQRSPLSIAASCGNVGALKLLVRAGANVNATTASNGLPIISALSNDADTECLELLISVGANVNARKVYPDGTELSTLCHAICMVNPAKVKLLLEMGADPNGPPSFHYGTPLTATVDWAFSRVSSADLQAEIFPPWPHEILRLLLKAGARVNKSFVSRTGYRTALDGCFQSSLSQTLKKRFVIEGIAALMATLVEHGAVWWGDITMWKWDISYYYGLNIEDIKGLDDGFWERLEENKSRARAKKHQRQARTTQ